MVAAVLTAFALATAAPVPVSGGSAGQRAGVRAVLAGADPGMIRSARIDARHYLVLAPPRYRAPSARFSRATWEAELLGTVIVNRLAARGEAVAGYEVGGVLENPYHGPPEVRRLDLRAVERLRTAVLGRARRAGLDVRATRSVRVGAGALDVVVRLRENQLLDTAAENALMTLFGTSGTGGVPHFLEIQSPVGLAIGYGGTWENGGGWSYGGDTGTAPVPRSIPRALRGAHADLVVHATRATPLGGERTFRIVCDGSAPAPGGYCARLLADRWALLVPMAAYTCAGGIVGGWTVSVEGRLAGRPVSRGYDGCYSATVMRWVRFLGLA